MTERKLTPEEIEELHEFCYFRSVWYYDVQVEIVDHLASAIEDLWETNPTLPFDEAMYQVGEQFGGDLGFATIKQEKEKALRKKYWRLLLKFTGDFYKFPKIMITLILSLGLYSAFRFSENDQWILIALIILFIGISLFYRLYFFPRFVKIKTTQEYPFLLNEIAFKGLLSIPVGLLGIVTSVASHQMQFSTIASIMASALISLYIVLLYGDYFFIPKKIQEHFAEQFPQFKIA